MDDSQLKGRASRRRVLLGGVATVTLFAAAGDARRRSSFAAEILAPSSTPVVQASPEGGVGPGPAWNGKPGSGYSGSPPKDPLRDAVKPAIRMRQAWEQRFATDLVVGVDAAAVGGVSHVEAYVEGTTVRLTEELRVDKDVNGRTRRRQGFWVKLNREAFTSRNPNGAIDIYFKAVAKDASMQSRVIGPYRFYPRTTEFTTTYEIGAGQKYPTLGAAIAAAKAMNGGTGDKAPLFLFKTSGEHDINADANVLEVPEGFWVVACDAGVTATLRRARLPDDPGENSSCWKPGVRGLEFRGQGLTLDYKNMWYIYLYPAEKKETRFNGCRVVNSAGRDSNYWYGLPHFSGGMSAGGIFIEDCRISDLPDCTGGANVVSCNRVINTLYSGPVGSKYVSQNCYKNIDSSFFFHEDKAITITHAGTGSAKIYTTGDQFGGATHSADYFLKIERPVGNLIYTLKFGRKLSDGNNTWAQVLATLQAAPELSAFRFEGHENKFAAIACNGKDLLLTGGASTTLATYFDFHQDIFHAAGALANVIYRGNVVYEEGYTVPALGSNPGCTFWRFADAPGYEDIMGIDNASDISGGGNGSTCSHVYIAGHSYARSGFTPAAGWDELSLFEDNIQKLYWANGTVSAGFPRMANNYINSEIPNTTKAVAGAPHAGNTVQIQRDGLASESASRAMFKDAAAGDFRPSGKALQALKPRAHSRWDARGYERAAEDAPGAWSINAPAPEWPFAEPA